jgi:predicted permease
LLCINPFLFFFLDLNNKWLWEIKSWLAFFGGIIAATFAIYFLVTFIVGDKGSRLLQLVFFLFFTISTKNRGSLPIAQMHQAQVKESKFNLYKSDSFLLGYYFIAASQSTEQIR